MKLEAKLENLFALVENVSLSLAPPPGKQSIVSFSLFSTSALYELNFLLLQLLLVRNSMTTGKLTFLNVFHILFSPCFR